MTNRRTLRLAIFTGLFATAAIGFVAWPSDQISARQSEPAKSAEPHGQPHPVNRMPVVAGIPREISLLLHPGGPAPLRPQRVTELMPAHREHPEGCDDEKAVPFHFHFRSAN